MTCRGCAKLPPERLASSPRHVIFRAVPPPRLPETVPARRMFWRLLTVRGKLPARHEACPGQCVTAANVLKGVASRTVLSRFDPLRARGMRPHRRRHALADPDQDRSSALGAGPHLGRHLRLHAFLERVHLCADLHPVLGEQNRAGRCATELVRSDVYEWGALMAGALIGSLPVVILYSFFVEYYVSSLTGAVKE